MKVSIKKHWLDWSLLVVLVILIIFICLHFYSYFQSSSRYFARHIQKTVSQADASLQQGKLNLCLHLDTLPDPSKSFGFDFASPYPIHYYVFHGDSLVSWNSNLIEPKLLRKRIPFNCDTIVHINSGDYLVTTGQSASYTVYLYSLLNTTYPIENNYFINKYQWYFGKRQLVLTNRSEATSYPFFSSKDRVLGYFQIVPNSTMGFSNTKLLVACLLLVVLCLFLLVFRRFAKIDSLPQDSRSLGIVLPFLVLFVFFFVTVWGFKALFQSGFGRGFFIPGTIALDFTLLVYFLCFLFLIVFLVLIRKLFIRPWKSTISPSVPIFVYIVLVLLVSVLFHDHWLTPLFGILVMLVFVMIHRKALNTMLSVSSLLVLFSLLLTHLYSEEYADFENRGLRDLALGLGDERDPEFERSYHDFLAVAQHDTTFFSTVLSDDIMEQVAEDYIRNFLFDSVMNQYNVKLTLCNPGAELVIEPYGIVSDCMVYFQDKVKGNQGLDLGDGLAFMDYNTLDPNYLSMINILTSDTTADMYLFMEFSKPVAPQGFGLLELLQKGSRPLPVNTSVACYQDSVLVYKYGSYIYPNFLTDFDLVLDDFSYSRKMKHYAYRAMDSKVVLVSVLRRNFREATEPFVFFFAFLLVLTLLVYYVGGVKPSVKSTLSRKFQVMIFVVLGSAFLIVGMVSVFYMRGVYAQKSDDYHFERTRTLLQDLNSEVDFAFLKQPGFKYDLDRILRRYSEIFYTDINIYGLDGKLLSTTCPEIQDLHLQASWMNAEAFQNMQGEKSLYYIHEEQLGRATYPSAYISIMDGEGTTLAYLNTPYYSIRSGLRTEIVDFVLTYCNIILLIVFLILPIILYFIRKVSEPLLQLQDKMRHIDINKPNELLEWQSNDEIGDLVEQYNQLVVQLEESAAELRRTATESAWRGAARQVAHEIKNSLTPMRLSVQMLERSAVNHPEDLAERIKRTSATLIEQIDALSDIASSFSTYAKLPENHPEPLDLKELVGHVVNLYSNIENIDFEFNFDPHQSYSFNGDRTNLNSAVTNLVKNATQAIGSKEGGKVVVSLKSTESSFLISVKDNGKGIKEEDKKMIFLPNFTTKSGGSGVGLSLTYNIVEAAGGTISFESEEGQGAEFIIKLPK